MDIEKDVGPRGSEKERQVKKRSQDDQSDQDMNNKGDDVRGTKRIPEDDGDREDAKKQESMIVSCLSGKKEWTRRDTHEASRTRRRYHIGSIEESGDKTENMAMDVSMEEACEQELTEAWDDIGGQELDPETVEKARALEMEWYRNMNVYEKECFEKTKKATHQGGVG